MRRLRSILIDNITGTIYTNITKPSLATASSVAAGAKPSTIKVSVSRAGRPAQIVNSNKPIRPRRDIVITNVSMDVTGGRGLTSATASPQGGDLTVRYRKVSSNGTETILGTHSIVSGNTTSSDSVSYSMNSTDQLFIDVISVGTLRPGLGLTVYTTYFG
jgi:hypothetical protein